MKRSYIVTFDITICVRRLEIHNFIYTEQKRKFTHDILLCESTHKPLSFIVLFESLVIALYNW